MAGDVTVGDCDAADEAVVGSRSRLLSISPGNKAGHVTQLPSPGWE